MKSKPQRSALDPQVISGRGNNRDGSAIYNIAAKTKFTRNVSIKAVKKFPWVYASASFGKVVPTDCPASLPI